MLLAKSLPIVAHVSLSLYCSISMTFYCPLKGSINTHTVSHVCIRTQVGPKTCGPLNTIQRAALHVLHAVIDGGRPLGDKTGFKSPVAGLLSPFTKCIVTSIVEQTGRQMHEVAVGHRVLVVVAIVEGIDLPLQATVATRRAIRPSDYLTVENVLGQLDP